jgi:hypothetical protein
MDNNTQEATNDKIFSESPNLEELRQSMSKFANERNWEQYHTPRNLVLAMMGEVGELAEVCEHCVSTNVRYFNGLAKCRWMILKTGTKSVGSI